MNANHRRGSRGAGGKGAPLSTGYGRGAPDRTTLRVQTAEEMDCPLCLSYVCVFFLLFFALLYEVINSVFDSMYSNNARVRFDLFKR